SINGMTTPVAHKDQTGRNVSAKGRKYLRACCSGPSWKTFQTPAMKKINPSTSRAKSSAQLRLKLGLRALVTMIGSVTQAGENVFLCEVWKVFENLFLGRPSFVDPNFTPRHLMLDATPSSIRHLLG